MPFAKKLSRHSPLVKRLKEQSWTNLGGQSPVVFNDDKVDAGEWGNHFDTSLYSADSAAKSGEGEEYSCLKECRKIAAECASIFEKNELAKIDFDADTNGGTKIIRAALLPNCDEEDETTTAEERDGNTKKSIKSTVNDPTGGAAVGKNTSSTTRPQKSGDTAGGKNETSSSPPLTKKCPPWTQKSGSGGSKFVEFQMDPPTPADEPPNPPRSVGLPLTEKLYSPLNLPILPKSSASPKSLTARKVRNDALRSKVVESVGKNLFGTTGANADSENATVLNISNKIEESNPSNQHASNGGPDLVPANHIPLPESQNQSGDDGEAESGENAVVLKGAEAVSPEGVIENAAMLPPTSSAALSKEVSPSQPKAAETPSADAHEEDPTRGEDDSEEDAGRSENPEGKADKRITPSGSEEEDEKAESDETQTATNSENVVPAAARKEGGSKNAATMTRSSSPTTRGQRSNISLQAPQRS